MRAIYNVKTVDRNTGAERSVRVEADSPMQAVDRVVAMGEMAGEATLAEILDDARTTNIAIPAQAMTGRCPQCRGMSWRGGYGCLTLLAIVIFFPLGLLVLLIPPRWRCERCGYVYSSRTPPPSAKATIGTQLFRGVLYIIILLGLAVLGFALWVAATNPR